MECHLNKEIIFKELNILSGQTILSATLNGGVENFITGDNELLNLIKIENMEIVSPRKF